MLRKIHPSKAAGLVNQPALHKVAALQQESRYKRSEAPSAACTIEGADGKKFFIRIVARGDDPSLDDVQYMFERTFGEEEVDPYETLKSAVDGKTPWDTPDVPYRITAVYNETTELVSTFAGAPLDLLDKDGQPTGDMVYYVGYAVTDPKARQTGLANEAYAAALIDATDRAEKAGKRIAFAVGECTASSERFWNRVGWKRIYAQSTNDSNEYSELPYIQPALDFNEDTGEIAEGAGEAPEHLQVDSFIGSAHKEQVVEVYRAFIKYNAEWPREAFATEEAYQKHRSYVDDLKSKFERFVNIQGDLVYMNAQEREDAIGRGLIIHENTGS